MGRITKQTTGNHKSFKRIGFIKIGEKTAEGNPKSLDHFIATGPYADQFHGVKGKDCVKFTVVFNSDNDDEVCDHREEAWDATGKLGYAIGKPDGGKRYFVYDKKADQYLETPEDHQKVIEIKPLLKEILTLRFIIPEIRGVFGLWELNTSGEVTSIGKITSSFDEVKALTGGRVAWIPFDLVLSIHKKKTPGSRNKFPILDLVPNVGPEALMRLAEFSGDLKSLTVLNEKKIFELTGGIGSLPAKTEDKGITIDTDTSSNTEKSDVSNVSNVVEEVTTKTETVTPVVETKSTETTQEPTNKGNNEETVAATSGSLFNDPEDEKNNADSELSAIIKQVLEKHKEADKVSVVDFLSESENQSGNQRLKDLDKAGFSKETSNCITEGLLMMYNKKLTKA